MRYRNYRLRWSEEITVSGFWFPTGHATLIINTGPHSIDQRHLESELAETSNASVEVIGTDNEASLLEAMGRVIFDRVDREYNCLVAYNAESWKGGFDLPFARTRCIQHGVNWVFDGLVFADLWEPVKKRLNTTHTV